MVKFDRLKWIPCDSRSDMEARAFGHKVVETLLTSDPNTWGYFQTPKDCHVNVGYANIGLIPQALLVDRRMVIGINECLVGYDLVDNTLSFSYRMPFVFHEFVKAGDPLIVRDEIGFVGISADGSELWKFCTEDVIESYTVTLSSISGKTADGSHFTFELTQDEIKDATLHGELK